MTPMHFRIGDTYDRQQISAELGGSPYHYLPSKNGRTLYGCFTPTMNPRAPTEVLVGRGPTIEQQANTFAGQGGEAVPIFLKRAPRKWEYVGDYSCSGLTRDATEVMPRARAAGREGDVVAVLFLRPWGS